MKSTQKLTCILCPNGCELAVRLNDDGSLAELSGNRCPRGQEYAVQEMTAPMRNIATSVPVAGGDLPLASCRLTGPIPRGRIFDALSEIRKVHLNAPVAMNQVLIGNLLGLGVDVIATRIVEAV